MNCKIFFKYSLNIRALLTGFAVAVITAFPTTDSVVKAVGSL